MAENNSNDLISSLRKFRDQRLDEISNGTKLFDNLNQGPKIVIHLTSEKSLIGTEEYEFSEEDIPLPSDKAGSYGRRTNELGRVSFCSGREQEILSYLLGFYTGKIEFVDTVTLKPVNGKNQIPNKSFERKVVRTIENCLDFLEEIGVEPPIYGFLTLDNVEGYSMAYDRLIADGMIDNKIRRDRLETPRFTLDTYKENVPSVLEKPLGRVWQACDFPDGSLNYEDGEWELETD